MAVVAFSAGLTALVAGTVGWVVKSITGDSPKVAVTVSGDAPSFLTERVRKTFQQQITNVDMWLGNEVTRWSITRWYNGIDPKLMNQLIGQMHLVHNCLAGCVNYGEEKDQIDLLLAQIQDKSIIARAASYLPNHAQELHEMMQLRTPRCVKETHIKEMGSLVITLSERVKEVIKARGGLSWFASWWAQPNEEAVGKLVQFATKFRLNWNVIKNLDSQFNETREQAVLIVNGILKAAWWNDFALYFPQEARNISATLKPIRQTEEIDEGWAVVAKDVGREKNAATLVKEGGATLAKLQSFDGEFRRERGKLPPIVEELLQFAVDAKVSWSAIQGQPMMLNVVDISKKLLEGQWKKKFSQGLPAEWLQLQRDLKESAESSLQN